MEDRNVTDVTEVVEGNTRASTTVNKTWAFTLNNYTTCDIDRLKCYTYNRLVIGKEIGSAGTPHLQGWIVFKRGYRLTQLKKLEPRIHWEVGKTTDGENYCMKENTDVVVNINNGQQGKRTDLTKCYNILKESGIKRLRDEEPEAYIKYHSGLEKLSVHLQVPRNSKPIVTWLWGPTGSGKTKYVFDKESDLWVSGVDLRWFDGYEDQDAVLFDDFRGDMCKFRVLLRLLDRYPMKVEVKGGMREWRPKRIYITSCKRPDDVYNKDMFDNEERVDQLLRRIDEIIFLDTVHNDFLSLND